MITVQSHNAPSPKVIRDEANNQMGFEETSILWGGKEWALGYLWSEDSTTADSMTMLVDD